MEFITVYGYQAIQMASKLHCVVYKSADPTEGFRQMTPEAAYEVAKEDPSLLHIHVPGKNFATLEDSLAWAERVLGPNQADMASWLVEALLRGNWMAVVGGQYKLARLSPDHMADAVDDAYWLRERLGVAKKEVV